MEKKWMIILGIVIVLLIAGIGYYYFHSAPKINPYIPSNLNEINSFFAQKNATRAGIINFCNDNKQGCIYYCQEVNRSNGFCRVLGLGDFRIGNVSVANSGK